MRGYSSSFILGVFFFFLISKIKKKRYEEKKKVQLELGNGER